MKQASAFPAINGGGEGRAADRIQPACAPTTEPWQSALSEKSSLGRLPERPRPSLLAASLPRRGAADGSQLRKATELLITVTDAGEISVQIPSAEPQRRDRM